MPSTETEGVNLQDDAESHPCCGQEDPDVEQRTTRLARKEV